MKSSNAIIAGLLGVLLGVIGTLFGLCLTKAMRPLDASWAGVIGALIGVLGTLATSYLTHTLQNARATTLADKRRARLRSLLSEEQWKWRSIDTLAASIGADENSTIELLFEIDARAEMKDKKLWALLSRAPYPTENTPKGAK